MGQILKAEGITTPPHSIETVARNVAETFMEGVCLVAGNVALRVPSRAGEALALGIYYTGLFAIKPAEAITAVEPAQSQGEQL